MVTPIAGSVLILVGLALTRFPDRIPKLGGESERSTVSTIVAGVILMLGGAVICLIGLPLN